MIGIPKHLNSKADYMYAKDNFPKEVWKPAFEALYADRKTWFPIGIVSSKDDWFNDDNYKVEEFTDIDGTVKYTQYELQVNENCKMYRIGFTDEEVLSAINEE